MKRFLQFAIPALAVAALVAVAAQAGSDKSCSSASSASNASCTSKSTVQQVSNTPTSCSEIHAQQAANTASPAASCTGEMKQTAGAGSCTSAMQTAAAGSCGSKSTQGASANANPNATIMQVGNPGSCTSTNASAAAGSCSGAAMKTASNDANCAAMKTASNDANCAAMKTASADACCATKGASASMEHCAQGASDTACLKEWSLPKGMAYTRLDVPGGVDYVFTGNGIDQLSTLCAKSCSDTAMKTGNRFAMASGEGYVVLSVRGDNSNNCCTQVLETALTTSGAGSRQS